MSTWNECEHEWEIDSSDWDAPIYIVWVKCKRCGCPGELDKKTEQVFWPTT